MELDINRALQMHNLAEDLDEEELKKIGEAVHTGYTLDKESRKEWEMRVEEWTKMALQVSDKKNFPWENAANVKYPLLSTASMQFAARAYPALVPSDGKLVQAKVIGRDPQGEKVNRANRIAEHMSWQLLYEMREWEEDMDKLLTILPIVGCVFKKTYYDSMKKRNCSQMVLPQDLVVNYWARTLEDAERKTEIIEMPRRLLKERQLSGVYLDVDLAPAEVAANTPNIGEKSNSGTTPPSQADETTPYRILEQHGFYDMDDDGYPEPYIITIEESSKKVLRIVARFEEKGIRYADVDGKQKIVGIDPVEYYTKFPFIPNPDGGFYDMGFGILLGGINEAINTNINQLVDAGTLNNLQSGFLSKGLRVRMGDERFSPGEWKLINATGEQMKNGILPLPSKEPSQTLLKLLELLISSGKELASVAEIFVGKMPGQNTPATTTMASIEQGMKLFTAIYKRVYKALEKEYKKLYRLNSIYLDKAKAVAVLDEEIGPEDYDLESYDVCPAADPTAFSATQKLVKAQALAELIPLGTVDPMKVTARILEAQEQPNWQELMLQQQAPDPKAQEMQQKAQLEQAKIQSKTQVDQMKAETEARTAEQQAMMEAQMAQQEMQQKERQAQIDLQLEAAKAEQDLRANEAAHAQNIQMSQEKHAVAMQQQKQKAAQKPKETAKK